jgi:hypothetical protein
MPISYSTVESRKMKHTIFAALAVVSIILLITPLSVSAQSPQGFSWSATPPNVTSVSWTNQQIAGFLSQVTSPLVEITVADFKFFDLDADGQLELLAAVDFSGRSQFNSLVVVRRTGDTNFAVQQIDTLGVESVSGIFSDINNDGKQELLVPTAATPYLGALNPQAEWTAIYGWSGPLLIDISSHLPTYYQSTILPILKQNLDNLNASVPGTIDVDIAQIEYDKALRISGVDSNAGFAQGKLWSSSADSLHRIFAAAVLADIGTSNALNVLKMLTTDADFEVSIYATAESLSIPDLHFSPVGIAIKPGDNTSTILVSSKGKIPIAILSTPAFDAVKLVDSRSLTFGSSGTENSLAFCNPGGEDVNSDGFLDLVCHFDTPAASFQSGDASGTLRGKLKDGTAIKGIAPVRIITQ